MKTFLAIIGGIVLLPLLLTVIFLLLGLSGTTIIILALGVLAFIMTWVIPVISIIVVIGIIILIIPRH